MTTPHQAAAVRSTRPNDADRDACIDRLSTALISGQLSQAEFDQRSQHALVATSRYELVGLAADVDGPGDAPAPRVAETGRAGMSGRAKAATYAGVSLVTCLLVMLMLGGATLPVVMITALAFWVGTLVCGGVGALLMRSHLRSSDER